MQKSETDRPLSRYRFSGRREPPSPLFRRGKAAGPFESSVANPADQGKNNFFALPCAAYPGDLIDTVGPARAFQAQLSGCRRQPPISLEASAAFMLPAGPPFRALTPPPGE